MQHGGVRPNSGRPKGVVPKAVKQKRIEEAMAREHMVKAFLSTWDKTEETIRRLAHGEIQVIKIGGKELEVYNEKPDPKMLQLITETVIGRPKQEIAGAIDLPQLDKLAIDIKSILEKKK